IPVVADERRSSRRIAAWTVSALVLIGVGIAIGSRIASPSASPPVAPTISVPDGSGVSAPARATRTSNNRTSAGAVAAAARSITAFDGDVLLDPIRLQAVVARIATAASRAGLVEAFDQASTQTRAKLGADTAPRPVIVLRS